MRDAIEFLRRMDFALPPFEYWSPDDWKTEGREHDEIRGNILGWDVTEYGGGDFRRVGLLLFTVRYNTP